MADKRRGLPAVPLGVDPGVRTLLDRVKALLEEGVGSRGAAGDRWVRASEIDGLSSGGGDGGVIVSPGGGITLDTTPPPAPAGLATSAGLGVIHLTWDAPSYGSNWSAHSHAVIRRGTTTVFADATVVGPAPLGYFPDPVGDDRSNFYYWVSFVSRAAIEGPPSAMAGPVQTSIDPSYITEALSSADPDAVLFEVPAGGTTINGVAVPAGVYMKAAYMPYGVINQLHFDQATGNRVIAQDGTFGKVLADTLKVLNANIAGEIKSDDYAAGSAGWRISKDGFAELSNAVVRGTVYADTGWFKGQLLLGNATAYATGSGLYAGDDAGTWKMRLGVPGGSRMEWSGSALTIYDAMGNMTLSTGSGVPWSQVSGAGRPQDNATAGATFTPGQPGTITGQINGGNASTYIANAAIGVAQIIKGNVFDLTVGDEIKSDNFTSGVSGWRIGRDGGMELRNIVARGDIEATGIKAGTANIIDTLMLQGNAVTVPVAAAGTTSATTAWADFSGQPVLINASFSVSVWNQSGENSANAWVNMRVWAGGTLLFDRTWTQFLPTSASPTVMSGAWTGIYGTGVNYFQVVLSISGASWSGPLCAITALGVKR